ncbi:DNA-directed RNA polymerase I, subunit RPA34.5 [Fennellomyces sp. T-0311]|nr:DNA-directed RNA polymerase I, subunit RPA34.5 [Fennellomyces sp. T-0311]
MVDSTRSSTVPSGFKEFKSTSRSPVEAETINDNDNELWLIRVPENVPLEKLNGLEIKMPSKKHSKKPLAKLSYKGEYVLYRTPQAGDEDHDDEQDINISGQEMAGFTCLLPEDSHLAYAPKGFSQYLVLDEQVDIPDSTEIAKEIQSRPPPKREQPENLQMRFKPYGFDTVGVPTQSTIGAAAEVKEETKKAEGGDKKRKRKDDEKEKKKKSKKEKK